MARLWSTGFELNSKNTGIEWDFTNDNCSLVTSPVRSGIYAGKVIADGAGGDFQFQWAVQATGKKITYHRAFIYIVTRPESAANIIDIVDFQTFGDVMSIKLNSNGSLILYDLVNGVQIGSASAILSNNAWYRIEIGYNHTTPSSTLVSARLEGVEFSSGIVNHSLASDPCNTFFGFIDTVTQGEIYFDDIAVNDNSG